MINRQLVHYDTAGQRVIIQPSDLTNVGGDVYAISPGGAVTSVADVPNTIPVRDADGGFEVGYLQIDTTPPVVETDAVGKIIWNDTDGTLEFGAKGGNVVIQIGQEEVVRVKNDTGGALTAGEVVYISGSSGVNLLAKLADATSEATSSETIGIVTEPIASSNNGFVTTFGLVRDINTLHLTEGAAVWLSTTAGQTTSTRPAAPNHGVLLGFCVRKHAVNGVIFVRVDNGWELDELHNVLISSVAAGDILVRNAGNTLWQNKAQSTLTIAESQVTNLTTDLAAKVAKAGDTMSGDLIINAKLGIATASPKYAIHAQVSGETWAFGGAGFSPALASSTDPNLLFGNGGAGFRFYGTGNALSYGTAQIDLTNASTIRMYTGNGVIAPTERLQVTSTGQLQVLGAGGPAITSANSVVVRAATYPYLHFVNNSSGGAAGDGFLIGIESTYANPYVAEAWDLRFSTNATERMRITSAGLVGIGGIAPTAVLHLKAGTAAANTAPLKLTSGTVMTTPEAGAIEFNTDDYYATITTGAARKLIVLADAALTVNQGTYAATNGRLASNKRYQIYATGTTNGGAGTSVNLTAAALATSGDMRWLKLTVKAKSANIPPSPFTRTLECVWANAAGTLTQIDTDVLGTLFSSGALDNATIVSAASGTNVVVTCTDVTGCGATVTWEIFGEYC